MAEPSGRLDSIWRVFQEEDRTWTITDDLRPGFVVAGYYLQDAVEELMSAQAIWDEAAEDNNEPG